MIRHYEAPECCSSSQKNSADFTSAETTENARRCLAKCACSCLITAYVEAEQQPGRPGKKTRFRPLVVVVSAGSRQTARDRQPPMLHVATNGSSSSCMRCHAHGSSLLWGATLTRHSNHIAHAVWCVWQVGAVSIVHTVCRVMLKPRCRVGTRTHTGHP